LLYVDRKYTMFNPLTLLYPGIMLNYSTPGANKNTTLFSVKRLKMEMIITFDRIMILI